MNAKTVHLLRKYYSDRRSHLRFASTWRIFKRWYNSLDRNKRGAFMHAMRREYGTGA